MNWFDLNKVFRMAEGEGGGGEGGSTQTAAPDVPSVETPPPEGDKGTSILTEKWSEGGQNDEPPKSSENTPAAAVDFESIAPPEGFAPEAWDGESLKALAPTFVELGLTKDQVTGVVHKYAALMQERQTAVNAEQERLRGEYIARQEAETKAALTEEQISNSRMAFAKIATPEMKALFDNPVLGSNKDFLKVFVTLWDYMKDDPLPGGTPGGTGKKRDAEVFFPTMNP